MVRSSSSHVFPLPQRRYRLPGALLGLMLAAPLLLAGVDEWVPPALVDKARQEYNDRAAERVEAWRQMMVQASVLSEADKLEAVNRFFNTTVPFRSDAKHWKKDDYWASPYEALVTGGGDCEDYVIAKLKEYIDSKEDLDAEIPSDEDEEEKSDEKELKGLSKKERDLIKSIK